MTNEQQRSASCVHFCRKCALVASEIPANEEGFHEKCGGLVARMPTVSKEQYSAMTDIEKQAVYAKARHIADEDARVASMSFDQVWKMLHPDAPICPTCGSVKVEKITNMERGFSVFGWGLASDKLGKTFKCNKCGYKW